MFAKRNTTLCSVACPETNIFLWQPLQQSFKILIKKKIAAFFAHNSSLLLIWEDRSNTECFTGAIFTLNPKFFWVLFLIFIHYQNSMTVCSERQKNQLSMQDSYVGTMYLILIKASSPPYLSKASKVSWMRSPTFSLFCWL